MNRATLKLSLTHTEGMKAAFQPGIYQQSYKLAGISTLTFVPVLVKE